MKTCSRALRTSDWGGLLSNRTTTLSTQPRQRGIYFGEKSLNVIEWPSQNPDLNRIEHLWRDLKIAGQWRSPSNLTDFERICREEWEKLPKYRCATLVASYRRRLEAVITAKGALTKYWVKRLNMNVNVIFQFYIFNIKVSKYLFLLCHYGALCVDWWGEKNI